MIFGKKYQLEHKGIHIMEKGCLALNVISIRLSQMYMPILIPDDSIFNYHNFFEGEKVEISKDPKFPNIPHNNMHFPPP